MYTDDRSYIDILDLDVNRSENFDVCYNYLINTLEKWYKNEFKDDTHIILRALTDKFLLFCQTFIEKSVLYSEVQKGVDQLVGLVFSKGNENSHVSRYQNVMSKVLQLRVLVNNGKYGSEEESPIPELIIPNLSDKNQAIDLLTDAIKIIGSCSGLKLNTRNKIIKFLTDALKELNSEYTNWTNFFGKVNYVKRSLVTISVLLGGLAAGNSLLPDKDKIDNVIDLTERSQIVIMDYSVNISRLSISNVFEIENNFLVEGNKIVLPESSVK